MAHIGKPTVKKLAEKCIVAIQKRCTEFHPDRRYLEQKPEGPSGCSAFLAAYLIVGFPLNIFKNPRGELESAAYNTALAMLNSFENTCNAIAAAPSAADATDPIVMASFYEAFCNYINAFYAWKIPDQALVTRMLKMALQALYNAKTMIPEEETGLRGEFATQIARLTGRLFKVGGNDALHDFNIWLSENGHATPVSSN